MIIKVNAEMSKYNYYRAIVCKQLDTDRVLMITPYSQGERYEIPSGASARVNYRRADGESGAIVATVNADGTVSAELTAASLAVPGQLQVSVSIMQSGETLTSMTLIIEVQEAEYTGTTIPVYVAASALSAGTYYIIVAGTPRSFTTTVQVPVNGTIEISADGTKMTTYNATHGVIESNLTVAQTATGAQLTGGPAIILIDQIYQDVSDMRDEIDSFEEQVSGKIDQVKEDLSDELYQVKEVLNFKVQPNLFDKDTAHIGKRLLIATDVLDTFSGTNVSDYIEIIGGTTYVINYNYYSSVAGICFYNSDKVRLSGRGQSSGSPSTKDDFVFTAPQNAVYMRFTTANSLRTLDKVTLTKYEQNKIEEIESKTVIFTEAQNLSNEQKNTAKSNIGVLEKTVENSYYPIISGTLDSSGNITDSTSRVVTKDLIPIHANMILVADFVGDLTSVEKIAYYDSSNSFLSIDTTNFRKSSTNIFLNNDTTASYCRVVIKKLSGNITDSILRKCYITTNIEYDEYLDDNKDANIFMKQYSPLFDINGGLSVSIGGGSITVFARNGKLRCAKNSTTTTSYYIIIDSNKVLHLASTSNLPTDLQNISDFESGKRYCLQTNVFCKKGNVDSDSGTVSVRKITSTSSSTIIGSISKSPFYIDNILPDSLMILIHGNMKTGSSFYCTYDVYESNEQLSPLKINSKILSDQFFHRTILSDSEIIFTDDFSDITVPNNRNAQSMCIHGNYAYVFIRPANSDDDPIIIRKIDLVNRTVVATSNDVVVGHANGCYYDTKNNYIGVCNIDTNGKITKIDPDTLESVGSVELGETFESILGEGNFTGLGSLFYSTEKKLLYIKPRNSNPVQGFFCFTPDFHYLGCEIIDNIPAYASQDGFIYDDMFHVIMVDSANTRNHIVSYDKFGWFIYDEPITENSEIEGIDFYNGELYAICSGWSSPRQISIKKFHVCKVPIDITKYSRSCRI